MQQYVKAQRPYALVIESSPHRKNYDTHCSRKPFPRWQWTIPTKPELQLVVIERLFPQRTVRRA